MLIRRKVFSVLEDELGEERLYSTCDVAYMGDEYYDTESDRYFSDFEDEHLYSVNKYGDYFEAGNNAKEYRANKAKSEKMSERARNLEEKIIKRREKRIVEGVKGHAGIKGMQEEVKEVTKQLASTKDPATRKKLQAKLASLQGKVNKGQERLSKLNVNQGSGSVKQADETAAKYIKNTTGLRGALNSGKKAAMDRWNKLGKYGKAGVVAAAAAPVAAGLGYVGKKAYDHYNED